MEKKIELIIFTKKNADSAPILLDSERVPAALAFDFPSFRSIEFRCRL